MCLIAYAVATESYLNISPTFFFSFFERTQENLQYTLIGSDILPVV